MPTVSSSSSDPAAAVVASDWRLEPLTTSLTGAGDRWKGDGDAPRVGATNWDHCPHLHRWHRWTENKNCSSMLLRGVGGLVIGSSHCAGGCQRGWAGHGNS